MTSKPSVPDLDGGTTFEYALLAAAFRLLLADGRPVDPACCPQVKSVIDDWCPLVNFFEHAHAAQAWAA